MDTIRSLGVRVWLAVVLAVLLAVAVVVSARQGDWLIAVAAAALLLVQVWQVRAAWLRRNTSGERTPNERRQ